MTVRTTTFSETEYAAPVMPAYGARCNASVVPALSWNIDTDLLPADITGSSQCVLLVLDSLGWKHLDDARTAGLALPHLDALDGGPATTVAPSTTAAALTSISTGVPPGEHGIVGYRFPAAGEVMNALRWTTKSGDWRREAEPSEIQLTEPFAGAPWTIVSDRMFRGSAFTEAYLGSGPYVGVHHPSSTAAEVRTALDGGASRVYAYYDGLDHVAHIYGVHSAQFVAELRFCDWLVGLLTEALPSGTGLVVTADHGQIDASELVELDSQLLHHVNTLSGEPRFRWLHTDGNTADAAAIAEDRHGSQAWIKTQEQVVSEGWLGPRVTNDARSRLGDIALIARAPVGFADPAERHAEKLLGRHGSITGAEMYVPVLHTIV